MICLIACLALFIWGWSTAGREGKKAFERTNRYGVQEFRSYEEAYRSRLSASFAPLACFAALFFIPGVIVELREEYRSVTHCITTFDPGAHKISPADWDKPDPGAQRAGALARQNSHCLQVVSITYLSRSARFKDTPYRVLCRVDNPLVATRPYAYYYYSGQQLSDGITSTLR